MVLVFEPFQKKIIVFVSMRFMKSLYDGKSSAVLRKTVRPSGMRKFITVIGSRIPQTKYWAIEMCHGSQKEEQKFANSK